MEEKKEETIYALTSELRNLSTRTVLFHQCVAERLGLNASDTRCLDVILRTGPATAGQLAETTGLTTGAITGLIDRLEEAGFVRRARDPEDRRRVIIELLPDSEGRLHKLYEGIKFASVDMCSHYTVEELELIRGFVLRSQAMLRQETARLRDAAKMADRLPATEK